MDELATYEAPARWPHCTLSFLRRKDLRQRVEQCESTPRAYVSPPLFRDDVVHAEVRLNLQPHELRRRPAVGAVSIHVRRVPRAVQLRTGCSCAEPHCLHVMGVLADLAVWPEFARAVMAGHDVASMVPALDARRTGAREEELTRGVLGSWLKVPRPRPAQAIRLRVWPRWLGTRAFGDGPDETALPGLEVFAYLQGRRTALTPADLTEAPLSSEDRALLDLCHAPGGFRADHLLATGGMATQVLQQLEGRAVMLGHSESGARPLAFQPFHLVPRVVERKVPRAWAPPLPGKDADGQDAEDPDDDAGVPALVAEWTTPDGSLVTPMTRSMLFPGRGSRVVLLDRDVVAHVAPGVDPAVALQMQRQPVVRLGQELPREVALQALRNAWGNRGVILPGGSGAQVDSQSARLWLAVDGTPLNLVTRLVAEYPFGAFDLSPASSSADPRRQHAAEESARTSMEAAHLAWDGAARVYVALEDDAAAFWMSGVEALRAAGVDVRVASALSGVTVRPPLTSTVRTNMVEGFLEVQLTLQSKGLRVDMEEVRLALRRKRRFVKLPDGSLAEMQARVAALAGQAEALLRSRAETPVRIPPGQWARVHAWLSQADEPEVGPQAEPWWRAMRDRARPAAEQPRGLVGALRGYQWEGVAFLQWLTHQRCGGILADDMGLGKTVQAVAWLLWLHQQSTATGERTQSLVVAPTSVLHTWTDHLARHAPALVVQAWQGPGRLEVDLGAADVVVTTYGTLRMDAERLARIRWDAVILDEAQNLKNADAVTTQAVGRIPARQRVALSGTPVENRPRDLWTLMDLCNPGVMGPRGWFESVLEPQLLRGPSSDAAAQLRARVSPFILRRRKADVLTELPPKHEVDRLCAPGPVQRRMYDAVAALVRADVARMMAKGGHEHARMAVLAALTRLRQVACDPRLLDASLDASQSTKRLEFLGLVETLVAEGRRALVFSSFVELLGLWRQDLHSMGIRHAYLDGQTTRRDEVVRAFQEGDAQLMLVSLKAGGVGLTLTAADTVILCDPWWNPAIEDQAADRAHRMGQQKNVTVYRLITQGTLEERILSLKARKRVMADALLQGSSTDEDSWSPDLLAPLLLDADVTD